VRRAFAGAQGSKLGFYAIAASDDVRRHQPDTTPSLVTYQGVKKTDGNLNLLSSADR
jgi:hypothetical protein